MKIPLIQNTTFSGKRRPLFVPRSQRWYWTEEWQSGEAEALREIADGKVQRFATGEDAARWLLS